MKAILPLLLAGSLLHAEDKAAQKDISAVYQQIEAGFKTWPHYTYSAENYSAENLEGGGSYQHHVWKSDGDNGLLKVESLNFDDHGESKVQFFFNRMKTGSKLLFSCGMVLVLLAIIRQPDIPLKISAFFEEGRAGGFNFIQYEFLT